MPSPKTQIPQAPKPAPARAGSSGRKPPGAPQGPSNALEELQLIVKEMRKNGPIFNKPLHQVLEEISET